MRNKPLCAAELGRGSFRIPLVHLNRTSARGAALKFWEKPPEPGWLFPKCPVLSKGLGKKVYRLLGVIRHHRVTVQIGLPDATVTPMRGRMLASPQLNRSHSRRRKFSAARL